MIEVVFALFALTLVVVYVRSGGVLTTMQKHLAGWVAVLLFMLLLAILEQHL